MNTLTLFNEKWPDAILNKQYAIVFNFYENLINHSFEINKNQRPCTHQAFQLLCNKLYFTYSIDRINRTTEKSRPIRGNNSFDQVIPILKKTYKQNWLQAIASLLAMLMHFETTDSTEQLLCNLRRPKKRISTYPNSPSTTNYLCEIIVNNVLKTPIPISCNQYSDAKSFAEKALTFKVIDPSMEAGQFLIGFVLNVLRRICEIHNQKSKEAKWLIDAVFQKLRKDCIWGIDLNPRSKIAVNFLFDLIANEFEIEGGEFNNIIIGNSLEILKDDFNSFDGILNNPPWGEKLKDFERAKIAENYITVGKHCDTYIAFCELALRILKPNKHFGFVIPAHMIAADHASNIRNLFVQKVIFERLILLPRQAYINATVRGLILTGRTKPSTSFTSCQIIKYPISKKIVKEESATLFNLQHDAFSQANNKSWWSSIFLSDEPDVEVPAIPLGSISSVYGGVHLYGKGKGNPPQSQSTIDNKPYTFVSPNTDCIPAIRGRDIVSFELMKPKVFVKFGSWLANIGQHESFLNKPRILLREICRRDGLMTASFSNNNCIPLHGVITIIPNSIDPYILTAILNSDIARRYVRKHTGSFLKVDFQKVTIRELRQLPIPITLLNSKQRKALAVNAVPENTKQLVTEISKLSMILTNNSPAQAQKNQLQKRLDKLITSIYFPSEEPL